MQKKYAKQLMAAALAAALAAGAVALPASAAADQAYMDELTRVTEESLTDEEYLSGLQKMMQKYPNSPEPYYFYVQSYWAGWQYNNGDYQPEYEPQLVEYLQKVITLGTQTDHPYQSKWAGNPSADGDEVDYTMEAARMKSDFQMWTLGQQNDCMDSIQQYLDCWARWSGIQLKEMDGAVESRRKYHMEQGTSAANAAAQAQQDVEWMTEFYTGTIDQTIPRLRAELESIRQWNIAGAKSFDVGKNTGENGEYLHVEGGKGDKKLTLTQMTLSGADGAVTVNVSQPILAVQRNLNGLTIFVPAGTQITTVGDGGWLADQDDSDGVGRYTVQAELYNAAGMNNSYNGDAYNVYVVGM